MKLKHKQQLHQLTAPKLRVKLNQLESELVDMRLKLEAGRIKDVHAPAKIRRQIAVVKTILTQKPNQKHQ